MTKKRTRKKSKRRRPSEAQVRRTLAGQLAKDLLELIERNRSDVDRMLEKILALGDNTKDELRRMLTIVELLKPGFYLDKRIPTREIENLVRDLGRRQS